jgi:hypothetical protein
MSRTETDEYKEKRKWVGEVFLPGFTEKRLLDATPEAIKLRLENMINAWFDETTQEATHDSK